MQLGHRGKLGSEPQDLGTQEEQQRIQTAWRGLRAAQAQNHPTRESHTPTDIMNAAVHSKPPLVAVFDVNETLSDMTGLAGRLEEVGAGAALLPIWFAALSVTDSR